MADIRINALATTATSAASDDYLALDGSANGTRKILATNVAQNVTDVTLGSAGPSVKSTLSARAPRQGLVFDGTGGAPTFTAASIGSGDFTAAAFITATSFGSNGRVILNGTNFEFGLLNTGAVYIYNGTTVLSSTGTLTAGKSTLVTYTKSGTSGTFYINGVSAGTVTDSLTYGSVSGVGGNNSVSGMLGTIAPYLENRALSASEVVALYEAGAPAAYDFRQTSSQLLSGAWTGSGVTSTGPDNFIATNVALNPQSGNVISVKAGEVYKLTGSFSNITGTPNVGIYVAGWVTTQPTVTATGATFTVLQSATGGILFDGTGSLTGTSVKLERLGLLLAPDAAQAGGGYVWNDQSGNLAQIVLPSSGVQWALPSVAGQRIRGTTSTNGNQQLLGASVLLPAECQITHVRARARSGTPTITIGTASGGAQIVASVALSTTWLNCTIALTGGIVSSADDIWIGSNSTDVVETDIAFQPLDF